MNKTIVEALYLCDREKNTICRNKDCNYISCELTKYPEFAKNSEAVEVFYQFIKHFTIEVQDVTEHQRLVICVEKEE